MPGESREYVVARYLEIEIAISRQLSYLRLIQDKAFLKTMVIIIITIYYYSLWLNTRRGRESRHPQLEVVVVVEEARGELDVNVYLCWSWTTGTNARG